MFTTNLPNLFTFYEISKSNYGNQPFEDPELLITVKSNQLHIQIQWLKSSGPNTKVPYQNCI